MRYKSRLKPEYSILMTPMIDVVFLLLMFFMVTYTHSDRTAQTVTLPRSSTSVNVNVAEILTITLKKDGNIYIKDKIVLKNELINELKKYSKKSEVKRIVLKGDELVPYGKLMEIMDIAKQAGIEQISLSTRYVENK